MKYLVEVYIPSSKKYSNVTKGLSLSEAAEKVVNNIRISGQWGNKTLADEIKTEIEEKEGDSIIFWCDEEQGAFVYIEAKK